MKDYSDFPALKVTKAGVNEDVFIVSLNRPEERNAIDAEFHTQVARIWREVDRDPDCRAIVFTGEGKSFCAGLNYKRNHLDSPGGPKYRSMRARPGATKIVDYILEVEKPIVSAINGDAIGIGCILALLGDITVAAEDARIGDTHINMALTPGDGGALLLPLLVGMNRAKEMLMLGEPVSGAEAARIGLVNYAVPQDKLMERALEIADKLAAKSPYALKTTKVTLQMILRRRALDVLDLSHLYSQLTMRTDDFREATAAKRERRKPRFSS